MQLYKLFIQFRFYIGIFSAIAGGVVNYYAGISIAWILYASAFLMILAHFLFGTLRLIQDKFESGNMEAVEKILKDIWFPQLLIKPVRSMYYTIQGNLAMSNKDYASAEKLMQKGLDTGMPVKEAEGSNLLQMSMLSGQKGDWKKAESYIRSALQKGLPDKESSAAAYLQMCSIMMNKRQFRAAKDFYKKSKALKPTSVEIVSQLKDIGKYISRMPG